jgi:hypothetical protein
LARGWLASWTRRFRFEALHIRTRQRTGKFDGIAGWVLGAVGSALGRPSIRQA